MHPTGLTRIAALLVALALADCAQNPVTGNPNLVLLTESQEIAMGRREDTNMSFHAITNEERAFAHPFRLRIITAQAGITFAELARRAPLGWYAEGRLRVTKGMYPSGEPAAGQALEVIE